MNIEIKEKMVPTKFVIIDDEEFELGKLICSLDEISTQTQENDYAGEDSLSEPEISYLDTMNKLVDLGLVKNYTDSRGISLYCLKDEKGVENLLDILLKFKKEE